MRVDRKEMAYRRVTTRTGRKGVVKLVRIGVGGWFFPSCFCGKRYAWSAERGTATSRYGRFVSSAQIDDYNRFWFHRRVVFGLAAQIFSMFCFHFLTGDLCQVILLHLPGFIVDLFLLLAFGAYSGGDRGRRIRGIIIAIFISKSKLFVKGVRRKLRQVIVIRSTVEFVSEACDGFEFAFASVICG